MSDWLQISLVLGPLGFFILLAAIVMILLPKKFLRCALKERKTDGTSSDKYSTSRLILFLSGLLSLALATCLSSFFIYSYLCWNEEPDLDQLVNPLLALGIGVIPYTVNQVRGAINARS